MRVVHVAPTAFGESGVFGGGERYPVELARALAPSVDCRLVTFGPQPGAWRDPSGLQVAVLRPFAFARNHPAHPLARGLIGLLEDADLIHVHHMRSAPGRVAALASRLQRRRLAVTDHGLGGGGWAGLLPRLFDLFLTVSRYSAATLAAPAHKTNVIYGGADPHRFSPDPSVTRSGVLFVGRLTPHKGVDRLIEALPDELPLKVVGSGGHDRKPPEREYPLLLRRLAAGRSVRFLGAVAEAELPSLYRAAQVFVLPSVHTTCYGAHVAIPELLGLTVLEAMASGIPVVCSRVGGLPEVVVDGETGYLVQPGNTEELRERIEELVSSPRLARRMGDAGREVATQRFTWERTAERCLAAYRRVLPSPVGTLRP